jgi:hypothetical protein
MRYLNDKDRRALQLGDHLQKAIQQWLSYRGAGQSFTVSPFIDPAGHPAVIVTMNADLACALIDSLNEQHARATRQPNPEGTSRPLLP